MAVKVGRFTDLEAVLVKYYRAKSSNGINIQGLTHVHGKSNLLIPAFKVGRLTDLVADFKSHLSLCTCIKVLVEYNRAMSSDG